MEGCAKLLTAISLLAIISGEKTLKGEEASPLYLEFQFVYLDQTFEAVVKTDRTFDILTLREHDVEWHISGDVSIPSTPDDQVSISLTAVLSVLGRQLERKKFQFRRPMNVVAMEPMDGEYFDNPDKWASSLGSLKMRYCWIRNHSDVKSAMLKSAANAPSSIPDCVLYCCMHPRKYDLVINELKGLAGNDPALATKIQDVLDGNYLEQWIGIDTSTGDKPNIGIVLERNKGQLRGWTFLCIENEWEDLVVAIGQITPMEQLKLDGNTLTWSSTMKAEDGPKKISASLLLDAPLKGSSIKAYFLGDKDRVVILKQSL